MLANARHLHALVPSSMFMLQEDEYFKTYLCESIRMTYQHWSQKKNIYMDEQQY